MIRVIIKAMVLKNNKILILKRHPKQKVAPGKWEMTGGKLELEESLEECLTREVKEETNIDIEIKKILYATDHNTEILGKVVIIVYLCEPKNDKVILSHEHSDFRWVEVEEFRRTVFSEIVDDMDKYGALSIEELKI
ncbi:MAG: NUDIX domain-containing protein [Bacillota bacterium]|nr:NUDIX domain-containing protein [Bacillota bacterium]